MLLPDYIVGLTDGEGSFTAFIRPPKKEHGSKSYRIACRYYIKLRDDDKQLLEKVKKFFGVGNVFFQHDGRPNHHHGYKFEIGRIEDLANIIIPFFKEHKLQSKKVIDFNLFVRIVKATQNQQYKTKHGLEKIKKLKSEMHQYRAR